MSKLSILRAASIALLSGGAALAQAPQQPGNLPDGPGKEIVQGVCAACHQLGEISRSLGYSREGWDELIGNMVDLSPAPDQKKLILDYLAQHYPPAPRRPAKQVAGPYELDIKAWKAIKLGQRTRDPIEAPDGMIWYVGQFGNIIGRIDPKTDKIQEWDLPPGSLPHSVMIDKQGGIWFTGNGNGTVGKFDPATGQSKVYKMPIPEAKDPHTGEIGRAHV